MSLVRVLHDALDGLGSYDTVDAAYRARLRAHGYEETRLRFRVHRNAERGHRFGVMVAMANLFGLLCSSWTPVESDWKPLITAIVVSGASPRVWCFVGMILTRLGDDDDDGGPDHDHPLPGT